MFGANFRSLLWPLIVVFVALDQANANDLNLRVYGHQLLISRSIGSSKLKFDGHELLADGIIDIDEIGNISNTTFIVSSVSSGGNACAESVFVISLPALGKPRLDGPVGDCFSPETKVQASCLCL